MHPIEQEVEHVRSIKGLVKELLEERPREYDAFSTLDNNLAALAARVTKLEALNMYYYCTAYRSEDQNIPNNVNTDILFDSTIFPQIGNMHNDGVIDNEKMYIRRDGVYIITGGVRWEPNVTGKRTLAIDLYGLAGAKGLINITVRNGITPDDRQAIAGIRHLSVGDYLTLRVRQASGGDLLVTSGSLHPNFSVVEIRADLTPDQLGLLNPTELTS